MISWLKSPIVIALLVVVLLTTQHVESAFPYSDDEMSRYINVFFENIFLNDYAIIAGRSKEHPDYFYDWVRDSGITLQVVDAIYTSWSNSTEYGPVFERYRNWNKMSLNQQSPHGIDIRGEVKFEVDSRVYAGAWCRPQNDGPALRAMSTMVYIDNLLKKGGNYRIIVEAMYGKEGKCCGVKYDLEYVSHNWNHANSNCDLWEEVRGEHFFTLINQRKALILGARLALQLDDRYAAEWYLKQALGIGKKLQQFIDEPRNIVLPSINYNPDDSNAKNKLDLDSAIHLGALYGQITKELYDEVVQLAKKANLDIYLPQDDIMSFQPNDDLILNSWYGLSLWSAENYSINHRSREEGRAENAIARYPNDVYDGYGTSAGNPWVLTTASSANIWYYTANQLYAAYVSNEPYTITAAGKEVWTDLVQNAREMASDAQHAIVSRLNSELVMAGATLEFSGDALLHLADAAQDRGDNLFQQIAYYMGKQDNIPEQIHRETGQRTGATYLTWSYGTMIAAYIERQKATKFPL